MSGRRAPANRVTMEIATSADTLSCPTACAAFARRLGFDDRAAGEIEIAAAELATNLLKYAGGGTLTASAILEPFAGIELVTCDEGPGFSDIETAMRDGFSEGRELALEVPPTMRSGLGAGLGAVARLMDDLRIENRPERGAVVAASKRLR